MLDIGCGTGFYAEVFRSQGGKYYLGIDITDQLFLALKQKFPEFSFRKADISSMVLSEQFALIKMISVTQHIVDDAAFSNAMHNIKSCLSPNGVLIVTSWLSRDFRHRTFYEVERPIDYYKKEYPDYIFSKPIQFRDKYIFSIRRP
jgi:SAM-dependent methyltransferase